MFELIKLLFDICRFNKGPKDLPYTLNMLWLLGIVNTVINFLVLNIHTAWLSALLQSIIGLFMMMGFSFISLYFCRKLGRFYQTTSALLGTDALIGFFALPAVATMVLGQGGLFVFLVTIALIIWHWAIIGHIMHLALGQSLSFSAGLALLYLLMAYMVISFLFPEAASVNS